MSGVGKTLLSIFFFLFSVCILTYAGVLMVLNDYTLRTMHDAIPSLSYIGGFLGVFDTGYQQDGVYQTKRRIGDNLAGFVEWKQTDESTNQSGDHRLSLADERSRIDVYSPYRSFAGRVSSDVESLRLVYSHKGRDVSRSFPVSLVGEDDAFVWSYDVHLGRETLFNGENEYLIEATFADGSILTRKVSLVVAYERIVIDDTILYLDANFIPKGAKEDILRKADDFAGSSANFITHGCDPDNPQPDVLIQRAYQYSTVPACMTFSLDNNYLLWFNFKERGLDSYFYDIMSPVEGVVYKKFPLFTYDLHTPYMSLVFFDVRTGWLQFLSAKGDSMSYALELSFYDIANEREIASVTHVDGAQLLVENSQEKMLLYMYKQRDNFRALTHPGMRYTFRYRGAQINQGPMYTLPLRLYGPQKEFGPTFDFSLSIDGTRLYIDDGVKRMSFDILLIGKTIEVEDSVHALDQPDVCIQGQRDIYQNTRGDAATNVRSADTLRITGRDFHVSKLTIIHNNKKRKEITVDQLYQGWFHLRVNPERGTLTSGKNTYTLVAYDARGKRICSLEKEIQAK